MPLSIRIVPLYALLGTHHYRLQTIRQYTQGAKVLPIVSTAIFANQHR